MSGVGTVCAYAYYRASLFLNLFYTSFSDSVSAEEKLLKELINHLIEKLFGNRGFQT